MLEQLIASQQEVSFSNEYCYDRENKNLLVRFSSDGTIEKYVYGNGLIASYEAKPNEETSTTDYRIYIYDIRGSVTEVADITGSVTAEYRYSTYGDRNIISGTETDELGYCARDGVLTETSGLLYMRARYYYPALMRFINEDIITGDISNSASLNRYTYVEGNPATMIDPFGLCPVNDRTEQDNIFSRREELVIDLLRDLLIDSGWHSKSVDFEMASRLYITLKKYGITNKTQICMFLGECKLESQYGDRLVENKKEGKPYSGGGYIQMTNSYEYKAYATFLLIENVPQLAEFNYYNPGNNDETIIDPNYSDIIDYIQEIGLAPEVYERYTKVYTVGRQYVADNYAWDSAGYYWTYSRRIKEAVDKGATIDDVSLKIKSDCTDDSLELRGRYYEETAKAYDRVFYSLTRDIK